MQQRRPSVDPRVVAMIAIALATAAIALEIVYAIGTFVLRTVERFPT